MLLHIVLGMMYSLGWSLEYEVVLALNCGSTNEIKTDLLTYQKDNYYSNTSRSNHKSYLSRSIRDPQERNLLKTERTHSDSFSYSLPLSIDHSYGVVVKFIEQTYVEVSARVFNIRLGDDVVLTVDIFKDAGAKRPLTKYFEFELKKEVLFLNHTQVLNLLKQPVLNGYDYIRKKILLTFEKVKGDPKIEAIILIRGSLDAFRKDYQQKQHIRHTDNVEYVCEKIYNIPKKQRAIIENIDTFKLRETISYYHYLDKLLSLKGLLSLGVFLLMLYQQEMKELLYRVQARITTRLVKKDRLKEK